MGILMAGAARREITPPLGKPLAGNPVDRPGNAVRVDSPLWVRVLTLREGSRRVVLIGLDLWAVDHLLAEEIRAVILTRHGVPGDQVMVWASHTHGGPAGLLRTVPALDGPVDEELLAALRLAVLEAVDEAIEGEVEARMGVGKAEVHGIGTNRQDPDGPMNPTATVLRVDRADGKPLAALLHYSCQPTLGNFELAYTADFPGYALQALEAAVPGVVGLFANGASGDVSTRYTRRGLGDGEARRIGGLLGSAAVQIYRQTEPAPEGRLRVALSQVLVRVRRFPPPEELRQAEEAAARRAAKGRAAALDPASQRVLDVRLVGVRMARLLAEYVQDEIIPVEIQAVSFGGLTLVGLPGDPFTEIGDAIRKGVPGCTVVVGYANGYVGHLIPPWRWNEEEFETRIALVEPKEVMRLQEVAIETGTAAATGTART